MRAVRLEGRGDTSVLRIDDAVTAPTPQGEEVRVRIRASRNRNHSADIQQRRRRATSRSRRMRSTRAHSGDRIRRGGSESLGPRARERKIGGRVFGITVAGAYAELVCVHERTTIRIPEGFGFEQAASLPENFLTAWDALEQGGFSAGGSALIHAAGSGVGIAGVQLVAAAGGIAVGTSRTPDKLERAREFGLTAGALLEEAWDEVARAAAGGDGVDVVLDMVGPSTYKKNVACCAPAVGWCRSASWPGASSIDVNALMIKRVALVGVGLRLRPLEEKIVLARRFERLLIPQFAAGKLRPVVDRVFAFDEVAEAQRYMEKNLNFGKIVVRVG